MFNTPNMKTPMCVRACMYVCVCVCVCVFNIFSDWLLLVTNYFKVNESHYTALPVISESESFSQLTLSLFIFFQYFLSSFCQYLSFLDIVLVGFAIILSFLNIFSIDFSRWKSVGLPHIAYIVIH